MTAPQRRLRVDLAYDGTDFAGWQLQPAARTVQGTVEQVLTRIQGRRPVRLRAAGRTDAGVHARRQVADCDMESRSSDEEIAYAMRRMLPADVRPLGVRTVDAGFDSRRDALDKTYRYRLDRSVHGDPFMRRHALRFARPIDRAALNAALALLPGRRDWSGFAGSAGRVQSPVRRLSRASFEQPSATEAWLTFTADGFLNHMVRNLVGTLLDVAREHMTVDRVREVLESGDRRRAGPTAPAHGLILWNVRYPGEEAAAPR